MITICCLCQRTRTPENNWAMLKNFPDTIEKQTISHAFCPECVKRYYPFVFDD